MSRASRWAICVRALVFACFSAAGGAASQKAGGEAGAMSLDTDTMERISRVAPADVEMMRQNPTEARISALPFYGSARWIRVAILLPTHPLAVECVDDGSRAFVLGAKPESVYRVNREKSLRLTEAQVAAYVRFFLTITAEESDTLVENASDVPWLSKTEEDEALKATRAAASKRIHPIRVANAAGGYRVSAQLVKQRQLVELSLSVAVDGAVRIQDTTVLAGEIPVAWLE
jgi:hypothetical protein